MIEFCCREFVPGFEARTEDMTNDRRTERIAAGLEAHFSDCSGLLQDWLNRRNEAGDLPYDAFERSKDFLRILTPLAGVIVRLETLGLRSTENRGSIPQ
jgi:hypothetical protein